MIKQNIRRLQRQLISYFERQQQQKGNFICDIILQAVDAECCILNSGSFRSDTLHPAGDFRVRDLKSILPYNDGMCVISVTGKRFEYAERKPFYLQFKGFFFHRRQSITRGFRKRSKNWIS
jgi:2',3'-cyclic-nucleotide 2'-phosphodiesterase (5'-nucleotidase family)